MTELPTRKFDTLCETNKDHLWIDCTQTLEFTRYGREVPRLALLVKLSHHRPDGTAVRIGEMCRCQATALRHQGRRQQAGRDYPPFIIEGYSPQIWQFSLFSRWDFIHTNPLPPWLRPPQEPSF